MYVDPTKSAPASRGPAMYFGYCSRSGGYRMMDLADYLASLQEGATRLTSGLMSLYGDAGRRAPMRRHDDDGVHVRGAGCRGDCDCRCTCCVCDADVLIYARCGETRRIPVTFVNDGRRERDVTLELGKFVTAGGRDVGWQTALSTEGFKLAPCGEETVVLRVEVTCDAFGVPPKPDRPGRDDASRTRPVTLDRCEVAYATLRAEGCAVRPIVIAIAVLPDDCDAYKGSCSCGCC